MQLDLQPIFREVLSKDAHPWLNAVILCLQILVTTETVFGNLLVMVAIGRTTKLHTPFYGYILNLATTDLIIGLVGMPLLSVSTWYSHWSQELCSFYLWIDWAMTLESLWTVVLIAADRFWIVTWPTLYQRCNRVLVCRYSVGFSWILVHALLLPGLIRDRLQVGPAEEECEYMVPRNRRTFLYLSICGYYIPLVFLCFFNISLYVQVRNRVTRKVFNTSYRASTSKTPMPENSIDMKVYRVPVVLPETNNIPVDIANPDAMSSCVRVNAVVETSERSISSVRKIGYQERLVLQGRRLLRILTCVVGVFLVFWIPFYILLFFEIFLGSGSLPEGFSDFSWWMSYLNSAANPLVYSLSNKDVRVAMKASVYALLNFFAAFRNLKCLKIGLEKY